MKKMLRVDVYLGDSDDPYETFFVDKESEIESRIDGYKTLFGNQLSVNYKVSEEEGDAGAHDMWGY